MNAARRVTTLSLGAVLLLLPAHGFVSADQVQTPIVSVGAATTTTGTLINVGQAAIGGAASKTHTMSTGGIPVLVQRLSRQLPGDLDGDGDADLDDLAIFVACLGGPEESMPPRGCTQEHFDRADVQADRDVDLGDYREIVTTFAPR